MILGLPELTAAVFCLDLEVDARRVEQDQLDLEVHEVRDGAEHLAPNLLIAVEQEVHRAVENLRVPAELVDTRQPHFLLRPLQRGELARPRPGRATADRSDRPGTPDPTRASAVATRR